MTHRVSLVRCRLPPCVLLEAMDLYESTAYSKIVELNQPLSLNRSGSAVRMLALRALWRMTYRQIYSDWLLRHELTTRHLAALS